MKQDLQKDCKTDALKLQILLSRCIVTRKVKSRKFPLTISLISTVSSGIFLNCLPLLKVGNIQNNFLILLKTVAMTFSDEFWAFNFFTCGEPGSHHCIDY